MKCPYCHIDFKSKSGFKAHSENCLYRDDPLPEPAEDNINLDDHTVKELKEICRANDISGYSGKTKNELIELVKEVI